jgi:hypothetical protein
MRTIAFTGIQFIFWSAFYALINILKDEKFIFGAFIVVLVISMVTTAVYLAGQK